MKTCTKCGKEKPFSEFHLQPKGKDGLHARCKSCRNEYTRIHHAADRKANPKKGWEQLKKYRDANTEYLKTIRLLACEICGYQKCFAALEFHHPNPNKKQGRNDSMGQWLSLSLASFKKKIADNHFIVLCANCHRELHHNEKEKIGGK